MGPDVRQQAKPDDTPDPALFWRWVGSATRPVVGWVLIALGVILIAFGYFGVSREALVAKQLPYLVSGGIFGMVFVAVGAFFLGTEDLRKDLRRLDRVEEMVGELHGALLSRLGADAAGAQPVTMNSNGNGKSHARQKLVALPRGRMFHLPDCSMVEGKGGERVSPDDVRERSLEPCSLCEPDLVHA